MVLKKKRSLDAANLADTLQMLRGRDEGITFIGTQQKEFFLSYGDLYDRALGRLYHLQCSGVGAGDELVLQLEEEVAEEFLVTFWACLLGKIIPVPLAVGITEDQRLKLFHVWNKLGNPHLITGETVHQRLETFARDRGMETLFREISNKTFFTGAFDGPPGRGRVCRADERDIAYIQFSSGSTGSPRGVVLTHRNLLHNIEDILKGLEWGGGAQERFLSWMPLTHDMGLIGFHLVPLAAGWRQYLLPTGLFIRRPGIWPDTISRHRVTVTSSPNFGYKYLLKRFGVNGFGVDKEAPDLSSLRVMVNGAEPISAGVCREFLRRMAPLGMDNNVMFPAYGLAEAGLAVALGQRGAPLQTLVLDRNHLVTGQKIKKLTDPRSPDAMTVVVIGKPVGHCSVRVVDDAGALVAEETVGHIRIRGGNVTAGYYNDVGASATVRTADGFLHTGDLGFFTDGALVVTGRSKDIVFVHGRNYYSHDIEAETASIPGAGAGKTAVAGYFNDQTGENETLMFVAWGKDTASFIPLALELRRRINRVFGFSPTHVIPVRRIPRTTSGKSRRFKLVNDYGTGLFADVTATVDRGLERAGRSGDGAPDPRRRKILNPEILNPVETRLIRILEHHFGIEGIGLGDDFFQLGGNSLDALAVTAEIARQFGVKPDPALIFSRPVTAQLAAAIEDRRGCGADTGGAGTPAPAELREYYPLSAAQRRMYFLHMAASSADRDTVDYNVTAAMVLRGPLDARRLETALGTLVRRHDSLRTSFHLLGEGPVQVVRDDAAIEIETPAALPDMAAVVNAFVRPFDLSRAPLLRVGLTQMGRERRLLVLDVHHIVTDGMSMTILWRELAVLYEGGTLPPLLLGYRDFALWQDGCMETAEMKRRGEYWLSQLGGERPRRVLPLGHAVVAGDHAPTEGGYERVVFGIEKGAAAGLKRLAAANGASLYMVLLTAYYVLLHRYTGEQDMVVGTVVGGREQVPGEGLVGVFINTLALRAFPRGESTFEQFLRQVRQRVVGAFDNQSYPIEELLRKIPRDPSSDSMMGGDGGGILENGLFDTLFMMQELRLPPSETVTDGQVLHWGPLPCDLRLANLGLTLEAVDIDGRLRFTLEYCPALLARSLARRLPGHYLNILESAVNQRDTPLWAVEITGAGEKQRLLAEFNGATVDFEVDFEMASTVGFHHLFRGCAASTPHRTALVAPGSPGGHRSLTYGELDAGSGGLARELMARGVGADVIVGIAARCPLELVTGILAILKAGGAYMPIGIDDPGERVDYMLRDSGAGVMLSNGEIRVTGGAAGGSRVSGTTAGRGSSPLAYLIYTSGTTGGPKGVAVEHRQWVNTAMAWRREYQLDRMAVYLLQLAECTVDVFAGDLARALLNRGELVSCPVEAKRDFNGLHDVILKHRISLLESTPSLLVPFMDSLHESNRFLPPVKLLILGSDSLGAGDFNRLRSRFGAGMRIINSYGVTEAAIDTSYYPPPGDSPTVSRPTGTVPIGRPLPNMTFYVLNSGGGLQPVGIAGEIFIGGAGVARGYLNRPELTAHRFFHKSYRSYKPYRTYRTGDLGRWSDDGNMEFLGRGDRQVKVRGYRVELGEIEARLSAHDAVRGAVVASVDTPGEGPVLCAYVVAPGVGESDIRAHLARRLPGHMVPARVVFLDKLPLTAAGKIDRRSLPLPGTRKPSSYIAPADGLERRLVEIWSGLLDHEGIGVGDNFFHLGGHSLTIMKMIPLIHRELGVVVPFGKVFMYPDIRRLASYIRDLRGGAGGPWAVAAVPVVEDREYYGLSSAQKRFYFLHCLRPDSTVYNLPTLFLVEGEPDPLKIGTAFRRLLGRHEILRTSFPEVDGVPVQRVHREKELWIESFPAEPRGRGHADMAEPIIRGFIRPFDLSEAPLLRVGLVKAAPERYILVVDMHHIVSDAVSAGILIREFAVLYRGGEPAAPRLQYRDYRAWQDRFRGTPWYRRQEEYWLGRLADLSRPPDLPLDYRRPAVKRTGGGAVDFTLGAVGTAALKGCARRGEVGLYSLLFTLFTVLLARLSGGEDLLVGTPEAGRGHPEFAGIPGVFVNTLVIRGAPHSARTLGQYVDEMAGYIRDAFDNRDYPLEELVEKLALPVDTSRNPLFDVMFSWRETDMPPPRLPGVRFSPLGHGTGTCKFDLTLEAGPESGGELPIRLEYSTSLFKRETVERFGGYFRQILAASADMNRRIGDVEIMTAAEKREILEKFGRGDHLETGWGTIQEWFEWRVERASGHIALVAPDRSEAGGERPGDLHLGYGELNRGANRVAHLLRRKGVGPDRLVGLLLDRTPLMVTAIWGVLKAGGAYLPIVPGTPGVRTAGMLGDAGVSLLLTRAGLPMDGVTMDVLLLDGMATGAFTGPTGNPLPVNTPGDLVYTIFTSGTTGRPRGVLVGQGNVVNVVRCFGESYGPVWGRRVLFLSDYAFDASVDQLFAPLVHGGSVHIVPEGVRMDFSGLREFIQRQCVDTINFVPNFLNRLLGNCPRPPCLDVLIAGGEPLEEGARKNLTARGYRLYNHYGPTETTVDALTDRCGDGEVVLGRPIAGTGARILGRTGGPVPVGVVGELCLYGAGLARGYLNNPEMTAEKFVFHAGKRMYRTGDLAAWTAAGSIRFAGRRDGQVKIRGYRVETGEIETRLLALRGVNDAVVVAGIDGTGERYLCAYLVLGGGVGVPDIRRRLSRQLPVYMVPAYFKQVRAIPVTAGGKRDPSGLPAPEPLVGRRSPYAPPRDEIEAKLVDIWADLLLPAELRNSNALPGIDDNFFHLGGHSLKAARVASRVHRSLKVRLPVMEVFRRPTVRGLADYIRSAGEDRSPAIGPVEEKEYYPLSAYQKRIFILNQFMDYNMPFLAVVQGGVDRKRFVDAVRGLIRRHESLRTSFLLIGDEPVQRVHDGAAFEIENFWTHQLLELHEKKKNTNDWGLPSFVHEIIRNFIRPFDLSRAPLLRVGLVGIGGGRRLLLMDMHHIVGDGVSSGILIRDFNRLYRGERPGGPRLRYRDFAHWQNRRLKEGEFKGHELYWLGVFSPQVPVLTLPLDYPRPSFQRFSGGRVHFAMGETEAGAVRNLAVETGTSVFMVLLAAFNALLHRFSGQRDIVVGTVAAEREKAGLQDLVGVFINPLGLRNYPVPGMDFRAFLGEVRKGVLGAFGHQAYPFEELLRKVGGGRDFSRNPLFDVMLIMQDTGGGTISMDGAGVTPWGGAETEIWAQHDITLWAGEEGDRLLLDWEYRTALFKEATIQRLGRYFLNLLKEVALDPGLPLSNLQLLGGVEKRRLLRRFNGPRGGADEFVGGVRLFHELFEGQVRKTPDRTALIGRSGGERRSERGPDDGWQITYRELDRRADGVCRILGAGGVGVNTIVGICTGRSPETVMGIVGIWKAGGAYLPLDPAHPRDRERYMLSDSGVRAVLRGSDAVFFTSARRPLPAVAAESTERRGGRPAYVIYTSGSTGRPRGVLVEHRQYVNTAMGWRREYRLTEMEINLLQMANFSVDVFAGDLARTLPNGGKLVICPGDGRADLDLLYRLLCKHRVTVLESTPALVLPLMRSIYRRRLPLTYLRLLIMGSDILPLAETRELVSRFGDRMRLINSYGVTEAAIDTSYYDISGTTYPGLSSVPIGKPLPNMQCYIVNGAGGLQPVGVPGELLVGGAGVARGYLNQPELTAEKFLFYKTYGAYGTYSTYMNRTYMNMNAGGKLYKTGDLARWLEDGNIEFLGRMDFQVKVRGFRVELGEIEHRLCGDGDISGAVVVNREGNGGSNTLCAYIVPAAGAAPEISRLQGSLASELPPYMIPTHFVVMERFPLTAQGKVDRGALLKMKPGGAVGGKGETPYREPGTAVERQLQQLWREVLGVEKPGLDDNFFQLGGDSLKAMFLLAKLHERFRIRMPLARVFQAPTIGDMAKIVENEEKNAPGKIEYAEERAYYEASSAQKRLYILDSLENIGTVYNMTTVVLLEGGVDKDRCWSVFRELTLRHESLRTSFHMVDDGVVQKVHDSGKIAPDLEFRQVDPSVFENPAEMADACVRPFDLSRAPLMRVVLMRAAPGKYILLTDLHHIVGDGLSMALLLEEFTYLYGGRRPRWPRLQYRDYSEARRRLPGHELKKHEAYWLEQFQEEIPVLELPLDYPRPAVQDFAGGRHRFVLGAEAVRWLRELALTERCSLFIVLLGFYTMFLSKLGNQEDIVVGTPTAGRHLTELRRVVGMFVNTLALRNRPSGGKTLGEFLTEVKQNTLGAFENEEYKFEQLVDMVAYKRAGGRNPLFDAALVLQNVEWNFVEIPGVTCTRYDYENRTSKFDITFEVFDGGEELSISLEYCRRLFKPRTIERFAFFFQQLITCSIGRVGARLRELDILSPAEKEQLLRDFSGPARLLPESPLLFQLFRDQAARVPGRIALCGPARTGGDAGGEETVQLSYGELDRRSGVLAQRLADQGVGVDGVVALMFDPGPQMATAVLGVLRAGGAYLPIDPGNPRQRVDYMLGDSGAGWLLTPDGVAPTAGPAVRTASVGNPLAYVIYTSGTTGVPRGVLVGQRGVVNMLLCRRETYGGEGRVFLQLFSYAFDGFVAGFFTPLVSGGRLVMLGPPPSVGIDDIRRALLNHGVTHFISIPALYRLIIGGLTPGEAAPLQVVTLAGEPLQPDLLRLTHKKNPRTEIAVEYGLTECSVMSTLGRHHQKWTGPVTAIGKPAWNTRIFILAPGFPRVSRLQPVGVPGELCIGGAGTARGYLNRPELTAEKFIYTFRPGIKGKIYKSKIYKSGDLGRWLVDGNIEFLGRLDHQVKIRGYRIELGEIEDRLKDHDDIKDAVVTVRVDETGSRYLCAYIVPAVPCAAVADLRLPRYLSARVPNYMVPTYFILIETVPLKINGKVDPGALPAPGPSPAAETYAYVPPGNEVEDILCLIWENLLKVKGIGVNDNFFYLGGHSLTGTLMLSRVRRRLGVGISLAELFRLPTIRGLASHIRHSLRDMYRPVKPAEAREYYPLSPAQKRLYIESRGQRHDIGYHIFLPVMLEGEADLPRLGAAFSRLLARHEGLRTYFDILGGEPVQRICDRCAVEFSPEYYKVHGHAFGRDQLNKEIRRFTRPFDLGSAPLMRVGLVGPENGGGRHLLMVDLHHIIADGASLGVLIKEFTAIYRGETPVPPPLHYKDYSLWRPDPALVRRREDYWKKRLQGPLPRLNLPLDHERPAVPDDDGQDLCFEINPGLTRRLKRFALEMDVTVYMLLMAVYAVLLARLSNQEDIIVGTPTANRRHPDLENVVGMFVNTLALRSRPSGEKRFRDFLREVGQHTLEDLENQEYPFDRLVEVLDIPRDSRRHPLFDAFFMLDNLQLPSLQLPGLRLSRYRYFPGVSQFDLILAAGEEGQKLVLQFNYRRRLFKETTVRRFADYFRDIVAAILNNGDIKIKDIDISIPFADTGSAISQEALGDFNF